MVYTVIAAGGFGSRMGGEIPKQFLEIDGVPIIVRTAEAFFDLCDRIVIGVPCDWVSFTTDLFKNYIRDDKVSVVAGGENRNSTLLNILTFIEAKCNVSDDDIVLTHDAVRPFVSKKIIIENIRKCRESGAAITAVKTLDTIGVSYDGMVFNAVPERKNLYNIQTPQTAKFGLLKALLVKHKDSFETYTDLCGMMCSEKIYPSVVEGDYTNIKITTPSDLKSAEGILRR